MPALNIRKKRRVKQGNVSPVCLNNRQKKRRLVLARLQRQAARAFTLLAATTKKGKSLPPRVEVILVTPRRIAALHEEFLDNPMPTDVITFHHGEIFVCPEIAEKQRGQLSLHNEVLTYIIHGFLHLCGQKDHSLKEFKAMRREQERVLKKVLRV
ncbi:MAG: rRNA maturation RNase YbeY [bacterium]